MATATRLAVTLACVSLAACDPHPPPVAAPMSSSRPMLILREDEGLGSTGFDGPAFVLYQDGLAVYLRADEVVHYPEYLTAVLSPAERDTLFATVLANLAGLDSIIAPPPIASDEPRYHFGVWSPTGFRDIIADGGLWPGAPWRPGFPPNLVKVYDLLTTFRRPGEHRWQPPAIEVLLWPLERSNADCEVRFTVPWPRHWPSRVETKPDGRHFVRLDSDWLPVVAELQQQVGQSICSPVRVAHRLWIIGYRYEFPGEQAWTR